MAATLEEQAEQMRDAVLFLVPDRLEDGHEPEARAVYSELSWGRYLAVDQALGDDRSVPRLYYLDGDLEIMSTSEEHERLKEWIGAFVEIYFEQQGVEFVTRGQATMRQMVKHVGAEPDKSWCLHEEKEFPDLVLEIALSSGGVSKLELYRWFGVPEVWIWRKGRLEVHALLPDGSGYERADGGSRLLPSFDTALLERCAKMPGAREARRAFRTGLGADQ